MNKYTYRFDWSWIFIVTGLLIELLVVIGIIIALVAW